MMIREELEIYREQLFSTIPFLGKWLKKKATKMLAGEAILGDTDAVNLLAEALTNHTDPKVLAIAGSVLSQLENPESIEAFCDYLMAYRNSNLLQIALDKSYAPKEEAKKALFYFITEQWEQYELLDFQEGSPLLRKGYAQASKEIKRSFLEVARRNGRSDILSETLVGRGKSGHKAPSLLRIGEMGDDQWEAIVEGLKSEGRWDEMLRILFLAPVEWAAEMVLAMKNGRDGGWKAKGEERCLWEEIMGLCPIEGRRVVLPDPTGELIKTLKGHESWVWHLANTSDGTILADGSLDRTVRLWSLPEGELIRTLKGHRESIWSLSISPDGSLLASGDCYRTVRLWSLPEGELIRTLEGHKNSVRCLSITPDGSLLASGSYDKTVRLWSLPDGEHIRTLEGHRDGAVRCLSITPDGGLLASGSYGETVRLWSLPDGELIRTLEGHRNSVWCLSITPDGSLLASGGYDKTVRLWSLPDGELIKTLKGHKDGVWSLSITPDGSLLASGGKDNTVRLWSLPDGEHIRTLEEHSDFVGCLSIGPDGKILASGSKDKTVRLWRLAWAKPLAFAGYDDLEYVQGVLQKRTLSESERRGWQFLEALLLAKFRFDITVKEKGISIGKYDIEIEG